MRMRILFCLALAAALLPAKETKVGFVESSRILEKYQATAAATAQFNEFIAAYRDSASTLQITIENLRQELEAQKLVLSEAARLAKLNQLDSLDRNYNDLLQNAFGPGGRIEQKNDELMAPLIQKINAAVARIAAQEGFSLVLDLAEGIYYATPELDLTELVVAELNREYGPIAQDLPTVKRVICVFPLREMNPEARNSELGQRCQEELANQLKGFTQYELLTAAEINAEMRSQKVWPDIEDSRAQLIASQKLCDYMVVGEVKQLGTRIEYTIRLKNVKIGTEVGTRSSVVTEDIKLTESLTRDLRELLEQAK